MGKKANEQAFSRLYKEAYKTCAGILIEDWSSQLSCKENWEAYERAYARKDKLCFPNQWTKQDLDKYYNEYLEDLKKLEKK